MSQLVFWKSKSLDEMSSDQWESLCDGCGKCCLHKLQDEDTDELAFTCISCQYLDPQTCQCKVYDQRLEYVPECLNLNPKSLPEIVEWLPHSCAYRLLYQQQELPEWHHLVSGDPDEIHKQHMSVRAKIVSELDVPEDEWLEYRID